MLFLWLQELSSGLVNYLSYLISSFQVVSWSQNLVVNAIQVFKNEDFDGFFSSQVVVMLHVYHFWVVVLINFEILQEISIGSQSIEISLQLKIAHHELN
jgi:glyoxylate carboligase